MNSGEIRILIEEENLIEDYIDFSVQITPNGFDLTAGKIFLFDSKGKLDFSNSKRTIPEGEELIPKGPGPGWWQLEKGVYKVRTNEIINLPNDIIALAFSRTSLLRMGAFAQNGVWDAGFKGKGEFVLVVDNPFGIDLEKNCRLVQLIFIKINPTKGYEGIYKNLR